MKAWALFVFLFFVAVANNLRAQTYELLPGSTITPVQGESPRGPAQALTGYFSWTPVYSGVGTLGAFHLSALDFESSSFSITLNFGANTLQPSASEFGSAYFSASVLSAGSTTDWQIANIGDVGTYGGSYTDPTSFTITNAGMYPMGGGEYSAKFILYAVEVASVPEPSSLARFSSFAIILLLLFHRRIGAKRPRAMIGA